MSYSRKTGETIPLNCIVSNVADLSTAQAVKFGMKNQHGIQVLEKTPVVNLNVLSVVLESSETLVPGTYTFEFRIKIDDYVESVACDTLILDRCVLGGMI